MFSRKWLQKATLQMKSMDIKIKNWDFYWYLVKTIFKSPLFWSIRSFPFLSFALYSTDRSSHFLWTFGKLKCPFFTQQLPPSFNFQACLGFFYEANSLVNFVNVFFLCVQNRQKKTIQPKQLSIAGWYNEENTILRAHSINRSSRRQRAWWRPTHFS